MFSPGDLTALNLFCVGKVTGATGATTMKGGPVVVARTGAGVYTLTLQAGVSECDATLRTLSVTMRTSGTYNYVDTSDTVITVNTFAVDGTTATDKNFDFLLFNVPPGQ